MLASTLKDRALLTLNDAVKVGTIDEVFLDAQLQQVVGFRLKRAGLFGTAETVPRTAIIAVGPDALTIASHDAVTTAAHLPWLADARTLTQALSMKVVTEGGELVGTIADLTLDDTARTVGGYLLSASLIARWRHQQPEIAAGPQVHVGTGDIIIVPNDLPEMTAQP
ncbi:MAG: hypothetical protein H0X24_02065 [Ktedonobacterales bacterium]|nr:hypothetical protein [Ktedonobacterales bacterium]